MYELKVKDVVGIFITKNIFWIPWLVGLQFKKLVYSKIDQKIGLS